MGEGDFPEASWTLHQYQHGLDEEDAGGHWDQSPCGT